MLPGPIILVCLFIALAPTYSAVQIGMYYDNSRGFQMLILAGVVLFYVLELFANPTKSTLPIIREKSTKILMAIFVVLALASAALKSPESLQGLSALA